MWGVFVGRGGGSVCHVLRAGRRVGGVWVEWVAVLCGMPGAGGSVPSRVPPSRPCAASALPPNTHTHYTLYLSCVTHTHTHTHTLPHVPPPPCSGRGERHRGERARRRSGLVGAARRALHAAAGARQLRGSYLGQRPSRRGLGPPLACGMVMAAHPCTHPPAHPSSPFPSPPSTRLTCATPYRPVPQLADFNFDGYTDVVLVSQDALWAWAQVGSYRLPGVERCGRGVVWCAVGLGAVSVVRRRHLLHPPPHTHTHTHNILPPPPSFPLPPTPQVRHPGALPFSALVAALMVIMAAVFVTQQVGGKREGLAWIRTLCVCACVDVWCGGWCAWCAARVPGRRRRGGQPAAGPNLRWQGWGSPVRSRSHR